MRQGAARQGFSFRQLFTKHILYFDLKPHELHQQALTPDWGLVRFLYVDNADQWLVISLQTEGL